MTRSGDVDLRQRVVSGLSRFTGGEHPGSGKNGSHVVIAIAAALCSTTVVTATLGFAFWALAARLASTDVVGRAAAVISAMQFIGTFATLGMHTLLIAELPRRSAAEMRRLVLTCVGAASAVGFVAAIGYALFEHVAVRSTAGWMYSTVIGTLLFGVGTAVSTVTVVLDGALIGVGQSGRQVSRNLVFSVVKLAVLPLAAVAFGLSPELIFLAWLIGNVVSLVTVALRAEAVRAWLTTIPDVKAVWQLRQTVAGHHWVNVATEAPRLAMPVLVAAQVSNEANAGFYAALLMATLIWIVPNHLATAMFALNSGDSRHFDTGLRTALRISAAVSVAAAVLVPLLAYPLLSIFGPAYVEARYCLIVLSLCTFASAVKSIYISVRRAQGALGVAAKAAAVGALLEICGAQIGLTYGGITGLGIGFGAAVVLQTVFFWPAIRATLRESAHRAVAPADPLMPTAAVPDGPDPEDLP